jgi:hypothetical protein
MILNLTLSRAAPGSRNPATLALFFTVKTAPPYFTVTVMGAVKTRHAAGAAQSSARLYAALVAVYGRALVRAITWGTVWIKI